MLEEIEVFMYFIVDDVYCVGEYWCSGLFGMFVD